MVTGSPTPFMHGGRAPWDAGAGQPCERGVPEVRIRVVPLGTLGSHTHLLPDPWHFSPKGRVSVWMPESLPWRREGVRVSVSQ